MLEDFIGLNYTRQEESREEAADVDQDDNEQPENEYDLFLRVAREQEEDAGFI